jgi:3-hydroxybutyryl-CoA dehydrogenase
MKIEKVGVLGCGLMGSGIAEVCAKAGLATVVREVEAGLLEKGLARVNGSMEKAVSKGRLSGEERDAALARLEGTTDLARLADCDLVIEAIVENIDEKRKVYAALEGLHFFNPVPVMPLVEVVRTLLTSDEVAEAAQAFAVRVGKQPVAAHDNSGFIVNRLLVPYLLDAVRAVEEGVGTVEDIDLAMKLGCGYPMGPLTLLDFVGLDTTYYIANIMFEEYREKRFAPPPLLKQMVMAGRLGRKSGRGFYDYSKG